MSPDDIVLLDEFTRIREDVGEIVIDIAIVGWLSQGSPEITWVAARKLPLGSSDPEVSAERERLLSNRRFFRVCQECGARRPDGYMFSKTICMAFAPKKYGVVF